MVFQKKRSINDWSTVTGDKYGDEMMENNFFILYDNFIRELNKTKFLKSVLGSLFSGLNFIEMDMEKLLSLPKIQSEIDFGFELLVFNSSYGDGISKDIIVKLMSTYVKINFAKYDLDSILDQDVFAFLFRGFCNKRQCSELINAYEDIQRNCKPTKDIQPEWMETFCNLYINQTSSRQVNIAHDLRETILSNYEKLRNGNASEDLYISLNDLKEELKYTIETDSLREFICVFDDKVAPEACCELWITSNLKEEQVMPRHVFRKWTRKNQSLLNFFSNLKHELLTISSSKYISLNQDIFNST